MSDSNGVVGTAPPLLNPATVVDAAKLALVIAEFIAATAADREHRRLLEELRAELRALVTDQAWEVILRLDHMGGARLRDLSVALVQWGFTEGLRYAGSVRGGGDR